VISHKQWSLTPVNVFADEIKAENFTIPYILANNKENDNSQQQSVSFDYIVEKIIFSPGSQKEYIEQLQRTATQRTPSLQGKHENRLLASSKIKAREITPEMEDKYSADKFIPRSIINKTFAVGENLVFSLDYGFYSAGTATMSVIDSSFINGGWCYHILTTAESNNTISAIYKVRDSVESYIDTRGIFSRRFEKSLREGGYSSNEIIDIYQDRLLAVSTKEKRAYVEIPLHVQDILSSLYFIRTFDLKVGKKETVEVYADGKVYPLQILVHKKEKVTVEAGTFNCFLIEPILKSEGIFSQKGKMLIWLSDDKNKIPVKMTTKIAIGNIAAKLKILKK